jgi:hypothetical protein
MSKLPGNRGWLASEPASPSFISVEVVRNTGASLASGEEDTQRDYTPLRNSLNFASEVVATASEADASLPGSQTTRCKFLTRFVSSPKLGQESNMCSCAIRSFQSHLMLPCRYEQNSIRF